MVSYRHNRPSSEPEYTATEAEKLNIHRRKSMECCHSGTQTPEKKRSSLIRSVSAPLESECDDCYSKTFVRCRACYAPLIREHEDARAKHSKPKSEYLPSLYNGVGFIITVSCVMYFYIDETKRSACGVVFNIWFVSMTVP